MFLYTVKDVLQVMDAYQNPLKNKSDSKTYGNKDGWVSSVNLVKNTEVKTLMEVYYIRLVIRNKPFLMNRFLLC